MRRARGGPSGAGSRHQGHPSGLDNTVPARVSLPEPESPLAGHNDITKSSRAIPLTSRLVVPASPIREGAMAILSIPQGKARSVLALTCAAALTAGCGGAAPSSAAPATPGGAPQTI